MASKLTPQKRHRPRSAVALLTVLRGIKLFATDVDGVLTDAGMYYSESGDEWKKFNTRDGMGIKLLQRAGIVTAIVTQERTKLVARRAEKLAIPDKWDGQAAVRIVAVLEQLLSSAGDAGADAPPKLRAFA